jgi:hypothetical protein
MSSERKHEQAAEAATEIGTDSAPRIPRVRHVRRSPSLWPVIAYLILLPAAIVGFNWLLRWL